SLVLCFALVALSSAKCPFLNGTDTHIAWYQGATTANVQFTDLKPIDDSGNLVYPIHLTKPLKVLTHLINNQNEFVAGKLLQSIKIYQYSGWASCSWSEVPTFGALENLDACKNGVPCPVKMGEQDMTVTLDFTEFKNIIGLLDNDAPYQLEMKLTDKVSNTFVTLVTQARAYTK
ncbi:hypothetical protein PMAYCL1PPCAC_33054, partial [Pristionchus mayeri]